MNKEEIKNITVGVSKECFKRLKILSIQNEISLAEQIKALLESSVSKKKIETVEIT